MMLERFYSLYSKYPLDIITYFTPLIPIGVAVSRITNLKSEHKLVLLFFLADWCAETITLFMVLNGHSSWPMQDARACVDIVFILLVYRQAVVRSSQKKGIVSVGVVALIACIYFYRGDSMSPWSQTVFRLYAIAAALTYYNAILADLSLKKIQHHSMFWFNAGLLFYAGGTLFSTLFNQYLFDKNTPDAIFNRYLNLMQVLYIVFCLLATVGFWVSKRDKTNHFERDYFRDNFH